MKDEAIDATAKEIIVARIDLDTDLYEELINLVKERNIKAAAIISITGSLYKAGLRIFRGGERTDPLEIEGPFEMSGSGTVTESEGTEPYIHVHLTVTGAKGTYLGHLIKGCKVRTFGEVILLPLHGVQMKKIQDNKINQQVLHLTRIRD